MLDHHWQPGASLGRYTLIWRVGFGGYGQVWRAADKLTKGDDVAVKIFVAPFDEDADLDDESREANEDARQRFRREAQFLRDAERRTGLRFGREHHIVRVSSWGEEGDHIYLVMPYVRGTDLKELLETARRQRRRLDPPTACRIVGEIGTALDTLHRSNLVHRDVKPSNVLIEQVEDGDDVAWLSDFGVVGALDGQFDELTRTGKLPGSGPYMAPERFGLPIDAVELGFDVYALACVLHEVLTGVRAFPHSAERSFDEAHRDESRRPRPGDVDASLAPFDAAVTGGLEVDPRRRTATVAELLDQMRSALDEWSRSAEAATQPVGTAPEAPPDPEPPVPAAPDPAPDPEPPGPAAGPSTAPHPGPSPAPEVPQVVETGGASETTPRTEPPGRDRVPEPHIRSRTDPARASRLPTARIAASVLAGIIAGLLGLLVVSVTGVGGALAAVFVVLLCAFGVTVTWGAWRTPPG